MSTPLKPHRFSGRNNIQKKWAHYGFIPVKKNKNDRRILAQCKWCHKTNANTSKGRMVKHRMFCQVYQKDFYKDLDDPERFMPKQLLFKIQNPDLFSDDSSPSSSPKPQLPELSKQPDTSPRSVKCANNSDPLNEIINVIVDDELEDDDDDEHEIEKNLLKERLKAETEYLHMKSNYYDKLNDLATLKRSLLVFETKKAQIEIHKLSNKN